MTTRILVGGTDGQDGKAAPEKGMGRVCDLDLGHSLLQWVIEGGIKLMDRSITSRTNGYWRTSLWRNESWSNG